MRKLNERQKLFLRTIVERNFYDALRISSYHKRYAYQLLAKPKSREYMLSILQETVEKLNLSHAELIEERLAIARDPETPAKVRSDILKDLAEMVERIESENSSETDLKRLPFLKPAKQLKQAEKVEIIQDDE